MSILIALCNTSKSQINISEFFSLNRNSNLEKNYFVSKPLSALRSQRKVNNSQKQFSNKLKVVKENLDLMAPKDPLLKLRNFVNELFHTENS